PPSDLFPITGEIGMGPDGTGRMGRVERNTLGVRGEKSLPGTRERIVAEMEKRTFTGTSIFAPPVPIRTKFRLKQATPDGSAAEKAAARYAAIEAVEKNTSKEKKGER
ncbi:MAG: hypothetical protein ACSW8H_06660, partial [bacterium]